MIRILCFDYDVYFGVKRIFSEMSLLFFLIITHIAVIFHFCFEIIVDNVNCRYYSTKHNCL